LVVLDGGTIQMLNPAAAALWDLNPATPSPAWMSNLTHGHHERTRVGSRLFTLTVVPFSTAGTLIVGLDVTEAEMVRERLQRSERLALVGQMLAQITHEVRNPLNAMSLNAELLMDEVEGPEASAMLRTITEEVRRLEELTERYLHLSRKRVPECQQRIPKALIEEVVGIEAAALEAAGLMVEIFGPATTEAATFDADAVSRALRNLIRNAAEAGAQALSIQVQTSTDQLRITLSDDGPGLSGEASAQAFDPFFTTKARGTGLGLAISRQELEEIGGGLEHDASHQGGAKFSIWLPVSA
jgi:signal transduction histidine kinase